MQINRSAVFVFLLLGAIAALYGQFLHNPTVFDDLYFFMRDNEGHLAIEKYANPSLLDLRALPYATLAWSAQLFGFDMLPFRVENLLLHWLVVAALALFVLRLYRMMLLNPSVRGEPFDFVRPELVEGENDAQESPVEPHFTSTLPLVLREVEGAGRTALKADTAQANTGMNTAVLVSVSLFALHPVAVYAAGYLVQRSIVMATLFSVLALWAYLHGSNERSKAWLGLSVVLYFLATHSKEHVIMLPTIMVAMTVLVHEDWRARLRRNWPVFAGYLAVALLTVAQIRGVIGHAYEINSAEMLGGVLPENSYFYSVLTQSWLFFKYGMLWLLPNPGWLSVDMREPLAQGVFSVYGAAMLAYLLYGFIALKLLLKRGRAGLVGFALLFPWLMFATEFSTVRIQEIFVLYRSYIWALGGVILLPLVLMQLNARLTVMVSVLCAATLFMISMERLASFSHPILLWDDAEKLVSDRQSLPGVSRIYYNRGTELLKVNQFDRALADLQTTTRLDPKWSAGFGNLGAVYYKTSKNELAIQALSRAIELDSQQKAPANFKYYYGRASAYEASGQWREAAVDYKASCLLNGKMGCDKASHIVPLEFK